MEVEALLEGLPPSAIILPVREMERILAFGEAAVSPLLSALERWEDDDERDPLPPLVLLGEIGHPDAVEPLTKWLGRPDLELYSVAAAEALAKIGPPAVPALFRVAREEDPQRRLFAYRALGWIPGEETFRFLVEALEEDPSLSNVAAGALADRGRKEAVPSILRALDTCPAWQRVDLEDHIRFLHADGELSFDFRRDWRLRYRVMPKFGVFDPGPLGISAIFHGEGEDFRSLRSKPVRTLEEILAEPFAGGPEVCEDCGELLEEYTGLVACSEEAAGLALIQHRALGDALDEFGEEDLFELLAGLEDEALCLEDDLEEPVEPEDLEALQAERDDREIVIRTCTWLVEQGVKEVGTGRALLLAKAGELADRFGDPEGLLKPPSPPAQAMPQPGRNDPCPCGSGKKFKKCCGKASPANLRLMDLPPTPAPGGPDEEQEDPRGPESRLHERLFSELLQAGRNSMTRSGEERALVRFLGPGFKGHSVASAIPRMDPPWVIDAFFEWLVFDFRGGGGRTHLETFLKRKGRTFGGVSRELLERSASTFMSLYRIEEVRPEEGFTLKDLFLGSTVEVRERSATRQLVRWDLIGARLMEMDGALRLTGGIIPFPPREKRNLLEEMEEEYVRFRAVHSGASREAFLKERGEFIYRLARKSLDAPLPKLVTGDGEALVFCRAHYQVEEEDGLTAKLEAIPGLEAEAGSGIWFRWVEPIDEGSRSLGSVEVKRDRLVLECMSEGRLARGKSLLEEHLGGAITHRGDSVQDPWAAVAERKEGSPRSDQEETPAIPPEVEAEILHQFMDQHYREWPDVPIPALGGKTPREAVAGEEGRAQVADLIREIEHAEARQQRTRGIFYDISWMWEELGLDPTRD
jgi:hypothetical protein